MGLLQPAICRPFNLLQDIGYLRKQVSRSWTCTRYEKSDIESIMFKKENFSRLW